MRRPCPRIGVEAHSHPARRDRVLGGKNGRLWQWGVVLTLGLLNPACAGSSRTIDAGLSRRIDALINPFARANNFSGTVAVADSTGIIASGSYGLADRARSIETAAETRYHIASVSKAITATAILLLVDDGRLSLDEPLRDFLPDFPHGDRITLHHLLTHTSGIPDINRFPEYPALSVRPQSPSTLAQVIASHSADAGGSDEYAYSNSNYNLLAFVIEVASRESYAQFVEQRIFARLGMTKTAVSGSERDHALTLAARGYVPVGRDGLADAPYLDWSVKVGNGSIVSTAGDLLTFVTGLFEGGLLADSTRTKMFGHYAGGHYGYGWFMREIGKRSVIFLNGNTPGYSAYLARYPADGVSVVVLANNDIPLATELGRTAAALTLGDTYPAPPSFPPLADDTVDGADYIGRYQFSWYTMDVAMGDSDLVATMGWPRYPMTLVPTGPDRFLLRYYWAEVAFDRDTDGMVTAVHWAASPDTKAPRARPAP